MTHILHDARPRDHGGNLDAAMARFGGRRAVWLDLSTGINPQPYPVPTFPDAAWSALPDTEAQDRLIQAARGFWQVPDGAAVLAAPGASALIAQMPRLIQGTRVQITPPTYNEHGAAFRAAGWQVRDHGPADARVLVHPNNPDGRHFSPGAFHPGLTVIDESFCDVIPDHSLIAHAARPGIVVLKSFGKFWGLAGLRLGFAIAAADTIARLADMLGPWPVSGPALLVGAQALGDADWAERTRARLSQNRKRMDAMLVGAGAETVGGTDLFGLYRVDCAEHWQTRLAHAQIWTRVFPYADDLIRLGLPPEDRWTQLEDAL